MRYYTENYCCESGERNEVHGQRRMHGRQGVRTEYRSNLKVTEGNGSLLVKSNQSSGRVSFQEKSDLI